MRGIACAALALVACGDNVRGTDRQGGDTTVNDRSLQAFVHPAANLDATQQDTFQAGVGPFDFQWEIPQLGPLYNNDQCFGCHGSNGRGRSQIGAAGARVDINGETSESLVRCSMPTGTPSAPGGDVPAPGWGLQLHDHATVGLPQIVVTLAWDELPSAQYPDGTAYALRQPALTIVPQPTGTQFPAGMLTSYRTAPTVIGLGLLEAVPEATLQALADASSASGDGVAGHINYVWNPDTNETEVGRFGWKANAPTVRVQAAAAAANDIGLTNSIFPPTDGSDPDINDTQLQEMIFMVATVGVPEAGPRGIEEYRGQELFTSFGCAACHIPTLETGTSSIAQLSNQTIHPYTDLLVHDMGSGLADNRPDFQATGTEWRTAPLWGLGVDQVIRPTVTFMHDGRARTFEEAILWHGGEAQTAHDNFMKASAADRAALLAFLQSL